eukprot:g12979.t1
MAMYKKGKFVGFNPTVKRTVVYCEHEEKGKFKISKGLVNKGYKTVGLAVSHNEGPMQFAAIIPMLDPPRGDTKLTIHRIREAGINVKMITGDHLNIAIETSRLIGLGTHVLPASELWPASATRDETIVTADGFAQVLPKDKREVILVLQNRGLVVGMTGDGVNDAPALAQAQIGIAVDGATEAARSAADIILTQPGLSAIFDAVVESRKIFARLRSYVLYRIGATIQIVLVLSILIYAYNDTMPAIYVILNDVTMLPVASDNASPSALPEIPSMPQILLASFLYGFIGTGQTMALYLSDVLHSDPSMDPEERRQYRMAVTYLQMSIAVELNIFSCRTPLYVANLLRPETWPSLLLFICVMGGNLLVSLLAGFGDTFHVVHKRPCFLLTEEWVDIVWIWVYDIGCLLVIDFLKRFLIAISNVIVQSTPRIGTLFFIYAIFSVCGLGAWASIMYLGTGLRYEIDDEGTVTLSESEDESDESRTWESDESECREFHVVRPHYGCLDGLACPRQLLLPVVLATLSQVAQWGIAASLGQIGAAMTDPVGCHGHQGKRVYRYALTSSMISVPIGSILSTAWNCPRSIFNALSCVQLLAAAVVGSDA